jgi:hypothetical protein
MRKWIARAWLRASGWKPEGVARSEGGFVLIAGARSSEWAVS